MAIYPESVKEFLVYTGLRVLLFLGALGIVTGVWWLLTGSAPVIWAVVIAFVVSGVASYWLLNGFRERFARVVEERAQRVSARFEESRAREDAADGTRDQGSR